MTLQPPYSRVEEGLFCLVRGDSGCVTLLDIFCVKSPVVVRVVGLLFHNSPSVSRSKGQCHFLPFVTLVLPCSDCRSPTDASYVVMVRNPRHGLRPDEHADVRLGYTTGCSGWAADGRGLWKSLVFIGKEGPDTSKAIIPSNDALQDSAREKKEPSEPPFWGGWCWRHYSWIFVGGLCRVQRCYSEHIA